MMSFDEMEDVSPGPTQHTPRNMYHPSSVPMQQPSNGQSPFMHFSPLSPWQNATSAYDGTFSISDASLSQQSSVLPAQSTPLSDIILPFPAAPPEYSSHQDDLDLSISFYNSGSRPASLVQKTEKGYRHHMAPYDMTTSGLFHRRAASRANEAYCSTSSSSGAYSSREHNSNTVTPSAAMYSTAMSSYHQYQYQSSLYSGLLQADPGWNVGRYTGPYSPHWQRMPESMPEGQQILAALSPQESSPASTDSGASNFLYH
ncbi:hypothetical protein RvY_17110 [Ramazzottius varieornatus]|uniref:Uncharacterized protein n=1 Tax=Ramazzottius varieornatus TaxID=947166 RepID=A0A1D1W852_RAMVA|nr:hypothetical protein RvY_17110 [Ramazzottius varieornatus]